MFIAPRLHTTTAPAHTSSVAHVRGGAPCQPPSSQAGRCKARTMGRPGMAAMLLMRSRDRLDGCCSRSTGCKVGPWEHAVDVTCAASLLDVPDAHGGHDAALTVEQAIRSGMMPCGLRPRQQERGSPWQPSCRPVASAAAALWRQCRSSPFILCLVSSAESVLESLNRALSTLW